MFKCMFEELKNVFNTQNICLRRKKYTIGNSIKKKKKKNLKALLNVKKKRVKTYFWQKLKK
jgi:hypothetical protein